MAVSRVTAHFPCPAERVWQTVTDLTHTAWRSDLDRVEILDRDHFMEYTKSGCATKVTITACEPPRFWAFTMENGRMSGSGEGIFEASDGGSRLTCAEALTARRRWMRPFVSVYLKRQQKRYLTDLRRELLK